MAHEAQFNFLNVMKMVFSESFTNKTVLEVGSLDINGTCRGFFHNCAYLGVDIGIGPCVDLVCDGAELNLPDNKFDVVISTECFEHNPNWIKTFYNMHRMCKPNGLIIMTCATTGRAPHGTLVDRPEDSPLTVQLGWGEYYKNLTEKDFVDNFDLVSMFSRHQFYVNSQAKDLYFWGIAQ